MLLRETVPREADSFKKGQIDSLDSDAEIFKIGVVRNSYINCM